MKELESGKRKGLKRNLMNMHETEYEEIALNFDLFSFVLRISTFVEVYRNSSLQEYYSTESRDCSSYGIESNVRRKS